MPPKPNARNWNDVQTAIATAAIVTTLAMWNLFAMPAKAEKSEAAPTPEKEPVEPLPPPTEPPVGYPIALKSSVMPYVKVMFAQVPSETAVTNVQQPQPQNPVKKKKKKNNDGGGGGGGGAAPAQTVTQTQSS